MIKLILIGWLLFILPLPTWADTLEATGRIPEQSVSGHFIASGTQSRLLIHVLPRSFEDNQELPSPAEYATRQIEHFYKSSDQQIALYSASAEAGSQQDYLAIPLPEELDRYDHISFDQVCRDPHKGLDQVLLSLSVAGTANADILDTLFVHYAPHQQGFTTTLLSSMYVESCSVQQSLRNQSAHEQQRVDGRKLFDELRPHEAFELPKDFYEPLPLTTQTISATTMAQLPERLSALEGRCRSYAHWEEREQRYFFEQQAENKRWQIFTLYYYEIWHSWGILLAYDKIDERWTSFYTVPPGGSKSLLYLSDYFELDGDTLALQLCSECSWWGRYKDVELDLVSFRLKPASID